MRSNCRSRSGPRFVQFRCVRMATSSHLPLVSVDMRPFARSETRTPVRLPRGVRLSHEYRRPYLLRVIRRVNDPLNVYIGTVTSFASLVAVKKPPARMTLPLGGHDRDSNTAYIATDSINGWVLPLSYLGT